MKYVKNFKDFFSSVNENKNYREVEPNLFVVKLDETENWSDDIKSKIGKDGKIFGVYLVDKAEITHLASMEGSYYLYWLYNVIESKEDVQEIFTEDELFEIENQNGGNDDPNMYVSERTKFVDEKEVSVGDAEDIKDAMETEEEYNKYIDRVIDDCKGNHHF